MPARLVLSTPSNCPVQGNAAGARAFTRKPNLRAAVIIDSGIRQRQRLFAKGAGHLNGPETRKALDRLITFRAQNPTIWPETLVRFRALHMDDLRMVMPSRSAALIHEFTSLT